MIIVQSKNIVLTLNFATNVLTKEKFMENHICDVEQWVRSREKFTVIHLKLANKFFKKAGVPDVLKSTWCRIIRKIANRCFCSNSKSFKWKFLKLGTLYGNIGTCTDIKFQVDLRYSEQTAAILVTCSFFIVPTGPFRVADGAKINAISFSCARVPNVPWWSQYKV